MTHATEQMALAILARVALALIRGDDVKRWAPQLEAILRELRPKRARR
jgi:hypothetical protein